MGVTHLAKPRSNSLKIAKHPHAVFLPGFPPSMLKWSWAEHTALFPEKRSRHLRLRNM